MDYFTIVNLTAEPFSNSPDPAFFFQSRQHRGVLQKLELALRLRRGLNVVIGEVGTGKTTLCRQLIRRFGDDPGVETHLVLDPAFDTPMDFLAVLHGLLNGGTAQAHAEPRQVREQIKQRLFKKGVEENKTVVLIIDEGQKLNGFCLELLRECLNYETNTFKLLQIVIFAQKEFQALLATRPNFTDRINLFLGLGPLGFGDTCRLVRFRLAQATALNQASARRLFSIGALWAIHRASSGYPRRIIHLCHQCLLAMIIQDRRKVGWAIARACANRRIRPPRPKSHLPSLAAAAATVLLLAGLFSLVGPQFPRWPVGALLRSEHRAFGDPQGPPAVISRPIVQPEPATAAAVPPLGKAAQDKTDEEQVETIGSAALEIDRKGQGPADPNGDAAFLPGHLGAVTVGPEEMLSWLMVKIYGGYTTRLLDRLGEANVHLGNPDRVLSGTVLQFPARPVAVGKAGKPLWWVCIGQTDRLEDAVDMLRAYPSQGPPARIIGHWTRTEGLRFSVVLWRTCRSDTTAQQRIARLPAPLSSTATVVAGWDPAAVFFADPYAGGSE